MQTFINDIDTVFKKKPKIVMGQTGNPEIKFSIPAARIVKPGDRIEISNTVYYEIINIISALPCPRMSTAVDVIANAKRFEL